MKYKTPLIIALVLLGSVGFVPSAHAVTSGCYSQGSDEIVQPVNGACPSGTSAVGTNGAPATVANGNLSYTPLEPLSPAETSNINFCQLLNFAFQVLIYLGGMFAVLALVIGGITYMVSGVANKISKAKMLIVTMTDSQKVSDKVISEIPSNVRVPHPLSSMPDMYLCRHFFPQNLS